MKALITGASSGIGYDMAKQLSNMGYDLIVVARRKDKLLKLEKKLNKRITIITLDLSSEDNCHKLYEMTKNENIDVLINNAGFGMFGNFYETDLNKEIQMIDLNIKAVHLLTKLYLIEMKKRDRGYILNVASMAAFSPGPLMATYYASKSYVVSLSKAISYELKKNKSKVSISCLCPGPVETEFNEIAGTNFSFKALSSTYVSKYALEKMFQRKALIIPGILMKVFSILIRLIPNKLLIWVVYKNQNKKKV